MRWAGDFYAAAGGCARSGLANFVIIVRMKKKSTPPAIAAIDRATSAYLESVAQTRRQGNATEHSYRPALKILLEAHFPGWEAVNEPVRQECGAPDFVVQKNGVALGYVEAKDIGVNLATEATSLQMKRYRAALPNLILTDYVEFRHYHYVDGASAQIAVAKIADSNFCKTATGADQLTALLKGFATVGESGRGESPTAERLAELMAGKARLFRDLVEKSTREENSELAGIHQGLREYLIRDLTLPDFADIFAQTATYGLFAARLESEKRGNPGGRFNRLRAGELLPQTTPFLRRFFNAFAGADMDPRISWMADDIAEMFSAVSLDSVLRAFHRGGDSADDPFLHFYETFLRKYDSKKSRACGVYFTPRPVVDFIVRAVDHSLTSSFEIPQGLADKSTANFQGRETHKVQILDPATGTGAFLAQITELVRDRIRKNAGDGGWKDYAPQHLLPRLHGFEILMSAYAMCHLKMALTLDDAIGGLSDGTHGENDLRVNVFLANALEMSKTDMGNLPFLRWLRDEAVAADRVKTKTPVMVVVGNPPYNINSQNPGEWIKEKLQDYRDELQGNTNTGPLSDDYIKFIRNAEHFIEKNGCGIVAMITNNSFYDGPIHRQMRRHLLKTFDEIRILNLRGDSNKKDRAPDGGPDHNVFDIQQGVGIAVMIKTEKKQKSENAQVFYYELQGKREMKYDFLLRESIASVEWQPSLPSMPDYFFKPMNESAKKEYEMGVSITELFRVHNTGIQTKCDSLSVHFHLPSLKAVVDDFVSMEIPKLREKYSQKKDTNGWTFNAAKVALKAGKFVYADVCYRPFDFRKTVYTGATGGFIGRSSQKVMDHLIQGENVALIAPHTCRGAGGFSHGLVSKYIVDIKCGDSYSGNGTIVFPLWVWEGEIGKGATRRANFREEIVKKFVKQMGMQYSEEGKGSGVVSPEALFDYIYAVLHRPSYRRDFAEFLRVDFPRIPAAADKMEFWRMSKLGGELRELHLLESPFLADDVGHPFSADGENKVDKIRFASDLSSGGVRGRVYINAQRYFADVPLVAWKYCIGGYYPAQLWLKKRKGESLNFDDQLHYRRMLLALARTAELVEKLDEK